MKYAMHFLIAIALVCAGAAQAKDYFAGTSYDIAIVHDGIQVDLLRCMTFHASGSFTLDSEPLSMRWSALLHYPRSFLAVTAPGPRTIVPYHMGVFGELQADGTLAGSGIYQDGSAFTFQGYPRGLCSDWSPEDAFEKSSSATAAHALFDKHGSVAPAAPMALLFNGHDPCWTPPGYAVPCDPPIDPLRADDPTVPLPFLGRSYRLTLGTSEGKVLEYCWTLGPDQVLRGDSLQKMTWSLHPGAVEVDRVVATGGGSTGQGMAYQARFIGADLLYVAGIEAQNGQAFVTLGYGQLVTACGAN